MNSLLLNIVCYTMYLQKPILSYISNTKTKTELKKNNNILNVFYAFLSEILAVPLVQSVR